MSNQLRKEKYMTLNVLYNRLNELEETRALIGTTSYYIGRRRVLVNHIENLLREILGVAPVKEQPKKKVFVFEVGSEEQQEVLGQVSVQKELVNEFSDNELTSIAKLFGVKLPEDMQNREQYLVTTIQGILQR